MVERPFKVVLGIGPQVGIGSDPPKAVAAVGALAGEKR